VRRVDGAWERQGGEKGTRVVLSPRAAGESIDYYLEIVDERQNVLRQLGSPTASFHLTVIGPPPVVAARRPRSLLWPALGVGIASVAVLATAVALDVSARGEFDRLQDSCAPGCTADQLSTFHSERGVAIAGYAIGGAAAVTALVLVTIDRVRARR